MAALAAAALLPGAACGPSDDRLVVDGIAAWDAWAGQSWVIEAPMYVKLENLDAPDAQLIGARAEPCFTVHVHLRHTDEPSSLDIPQGERRFLNPAGWHLMCVGLQRPLEIGEEFDVHLVFDRHETITVTMPVRENPDGFGHDH